jgi:hypothetical protein
MTTTPAQASALSAEALTLFAALKAELPSGELGTAEERDQVTALQVTVNAYIADGASAAVLGGLTRLQTGLDRIAVILGLYDESEGGGGVGGEDGQLDLSVDGNALNPVLL